MTRFNTLLLDQSQWDLVLDANGNMAMAKPTYSLAQDVSSACRLFLGELWFDTSKGVPYFDQVLGELPPQSYVTALLEKAALTVPGVVSARCVIQSLQDRNVSGQILFVDETGEPNSVNF